MREASLAGKLRALREDPILFARLVGFRPLPYQAELLRDRSKRIVACWGRQTGKSTTAALKALHFAFTHRESTVLIISPSKRQSELMFEKVRGFLHARVRLGGRELRPLEGSVARETRDSVLLTNGSRVIALPCSPERVRGFTAHMVIVDEAAFVPEELITSVLMPMLATTDGTLVLLSTPWTRDHIFYRAFSGQLPGWSVHHVPSTACPLISRGFLAEQERALTKAEFKREYLAELAEEGACFFPSALVLKCVDPELRLAEDAGELAAMGHGRVELYAGLDLAKLRDQSVLAVVEREKRPEGHLLLRLLRAFPVGTPYSAVIAEVAAVVRSLGVVALAVDRSGPGEAVFEQLAAELGASRVLGFRFTAESKAELLSGLKVLMEKGWLRLPYHRPLLGQLTAITCEMRSSGRLLLRHPPRGHDDMVMALALACWAARQPRGAAVRLA